MPVPRLPAQGSGAKREHSDKLTDRWTIKAVLLDMDGTLLDTEKLFMESLVAAHERLWNLGHPPIGER